MHDILFVQLRELGLKPWSDMAQEAGLADLAAFEVCNRSKGPVPRVADGIRLGKDLDVKGTPTLLVNGWKLGRTPSLDELDAMVKAVLAGRSPVDALDQSPSSD